jgi:hypothetical protein
MSEQLIPTSEVGASSPVANPDVANAAQTSGSQSNLRILLTIYTLALALIYAFLGFMWLLSHPPEQMSLPSSPAVLEEVTLGQPEDIGFGNLNVPVSVTNTTNMTFTYSVTVTSDAKAPESELERWTVVFEQVEPGETAEAEVVFTEPLPVHATFEVIEATRM